MALHPTWAQLAFQDLFLFLPKIGVGKLVLSFYVAEKRQVMESMWKCFVKPVMGKAALLLHTDSVTYSPVLPGKLAWQTVLLI